MQWGGGASEPIERPIGRFRENFGLWMLWALIPLLGWVAWVQAGIRARSWRLALYGAPYLALSLPFFISGADGEAPDWAGWLMFAAWAGCIVHVIVQRKSANRAIYMRTEPRRAGRRTKRDQRGQERREQRERAAMESRRRQEQAAVERQRAAAEAAAQQRAEKSPDLAAPRAAQVRGEEAALAKPPADEAPSLARSDAEGPSPGPAKVAASPRGVSAAEGVAYGCGAWLLAVILTVVVDLIISIYARHAIADTFSGEDTAGTGVILILLGVLTFFWTIALVGWGFWLLVGAGGAALLSREERKSAEDGAGIEG